MHETKAEALFATSDLTADLGFFSKALGFRLDKIYPADDPSVAVMSGHGLRLRLDRDAAGNNTTLFLQSDNWPEIADGQTQLTAPGGTKIHLGPLSESYEMPDTAHAFVVRRLKDEAPWVIGRAGMHYRDLIPSRLGGSIIASHIRIPDGGPVPDMVHYHTVGFQLIFCYKGWVDVLYEDQGDMMRLEAGDCVIQPPEIRHRVCHASAEIEVIEIGVPAEHVTTIDHEMTLPNGKGDPAREWQGQTFVHHVKEGATWQDFRLPGFRCRDTGINAGTKGVASIQVVQGGADVSYSHDCDILFTFVMAGQMTLSADGQSDRLLGPGDAFVIPPGLETRYHACSKDLELLEAALPGGFVTRIIA